MSDQPIRCGNCGQPLKPSGRGGAFRKTQRFCGPKCARAKQVIVYRSIEERFNKWVRVEPSGCWRWTGSLSTSGYGRIRDKGAKGRVIHAHVYAYERKYGPVPDGLELDDLCRNRWCCNPDHVQAVTHRENAMRGQAPAILVHKSGHCKRGHERNEANTYYYRKDNARNGRVAACRVCKREKRRAERVRVSGPSDSTRPPAQLEMRALS